MTTDMKRLEEIIDYKNVTGYIDEQQTRDMVIIVAEIMYELLKEKYDKIKET